MATFVDKLAALGRGEASLREVTAALEALVLHEPAGVEEAQSLLKRARAAGLPETLHARLVAHIERTLDSGATRAATRAGAVAVGHASSQGVAAPQIGSEKTVLLAALDPDDTSPQPLDDGDVTRLQSAPGGSRRRSDAGWTNAVSTSASLDATTRLGRGAAEAAAQRVAGTGDEATRMGARAHGAGPADASAREDPEDVTRLDGGGPQGRDAITSTDRVGVDVTQAGASGVVERGNRTAVDSASGTAGVTDDRTEVNPAADQATQTEINPATDEATQFNRRTVDATQVVTPDSDRTLVSPQAIDDAFDILSSDAMLAAEDSRRQQTTGGGDWSTDGTPSAATQVGQVVFEEGSVLRNRFILEAKLGEGGMGAVWKGVDKLKQEARDRNPYVAIKLLQGDFKDHPEAFIALQRETSKQQRLAHPNIATVFDFDRDDNTNTVFMTMEVLGGTDLAAHIRRKLPPDGLAYEDAMHLIRQLGEGLGYAHKAGLVHSDLKPGNCFLTDEGVVKLLDFGIARASKTKADAEGETTVFDPGQLGALTPAYATIEMFDGKDPDPRDDIYALAIIAYQLLTGKHPYGKKNAPKAEAAGLTVPPVDKLTKAQNRALAQGLAFRREDRTATVEEFLEGLGEKKGNVVTKVLVALVAAAVLAIGYPFAVQEIDKQERESLISAIVAGGPANLESTLAAVTTLGDEEQRRLILEDSRTRETVINLFTEGGEQGIDRGFALVRGVSQAFTEDMLQVPAVEDAVVNLYRNKVYAAFAPSEGRLNFADASRQVDILKGIYPRAAGTFVLEAELRDRRAEALTRLEDRFNTLIDTGKLLRDDSGQDIFDVRDRVARIDPNHPLLTSKLVTLRLGELAEAAMATLEYQQAQALLAASLAYAPEQDELADLRYQVEQELRRQRNEQLVAEIEARLRAQEANFTTLAAFQAVRDDLIKLADLAPGSEVLELLQSRLVGAFDTAQANLIAAAKWTEAEQLLADFAKLFPLSYLDEQRAALSAAEDAAGFALAEDAQRTAAVVARREAIAALIAKPDFGSDWEIALQVPFKEMIALLPSGAPAIGPIREQIASLYLKEAEAARSNELTTRARSLVARGRAFFPEFAGFAEALARIAETDAVVERKRAEAARVARVDRNFNQAVNRSKTNETQVAEKALAQLEADAGSAEAEKVAQAREALGLAYGRLAESPAAKEEWGQALKLLERALELAPGTEALEETVRRYRSEYQKVVAVERFKELLQDPRPLTSSAVDTALAKVKADFPERYADKYQAEFASLAAARFEALRVDSSAGLKVASTELAVVRRHFPSVLDTAESRLAERLASRVRELEKRDVNAAQSFLQGALALTPKAPPLTSIKLKIPSKLAEQGKALVAEGKLTRALEVLDQALAKEPDAPNIPDFRTALAARKQLAERNFVNFDKYKRARRARQGKPFLDKAIEQWTDNQTWLAELASLTKTPPKGKRYSCEPMKAGLGTKARATCFDEIAGNRGPVMVVVPAGGGVAEPFAIGKLEVTVADYNLYCRTSGGCPAVSGDEKLPITGVSVGAAEAYAAWLSQQTGATYRLPTDNEWEHAATAGGKQPRKDFNCTVTVGNQTLKGQSLVTALSGKQNGWGLINYVGNAKEWVKAGGAVAVRGGAYTDPMAKCSISLRETHPGSPDPLTGFRLVREIG